MQPPRLHAKKPTPHRIAPLLVRSSAPVAGPLRARVKDRALLHGMAFSLPPSFQKEKEREPSQAEFCARDRDDAIKIHVANEFSELGNFLWRYVQSSMQKQTRSDFFFFFFKVKTRGDTRSRDRRDDAIDNNGQNFQQLKEDNTFSSSHFHRSIMFIDPKMELQG